jgi:hypothetical protein
VARVLTPLAILSLILIAHLGAQQPATPAAGTGPATAPPLGAGAGAPTVPAPPVVVLPIKPPRHLLPAEEKSRAVTRFSFIVYGDTRGAASTDNAIPQPNHAGLVDTMLATVKARAKTPYPVRFVLQTGDAVLNGTVGEAWNDSYRPVANRITGADLPYFLTAGNHDVGIVPIGDPRRTLGLNNMLSAFKAILPPDGSARRLSGYPTYALGYGNVFVIAIDSNIASDPLQLEWVTGQLERLDRVRFPHVVAFMHHPPYSSGPHGGATMEPQTLAVRSLYMPLFRKHHVRMVASGHEHFFEHWTERYLDGAQPYRIDTVVTGGGGAPTYTYRGEPDLAAYVAAAPGQEVKVEHVAKPGMTIPENPFHFVVIEVDGNRLTAEVVATGNAAFTPFGGSNRFELTDRP